MRWYWVGYTDPMAAKGHQAKGAAIVQAWSEEDAVLTLDHRGVRQHAWWVALVGVIPEEWGEPPMSLPSSARGCSGLLNAIEAEALAIGWDPARRGLAGAEDIKAAFLDDQAKDGDPLFGKPRPS
jgi:hypothetical protein